MSRFLCAGIVLNVNFVQHPERRSKSRPSTLPPSRPGHKAVRPNSHLHGCSVSDSLTPCAPAGAARSWGAVLDPSGRGFMQSTAVVETWSAESLLNYFPQTMLETSSWKHGKRYVSCSRPVEAVGDLLPVALAWAANKLGSATCSLRTTITRCFCADRHPVCEDDRERGHKPSPPASSMTCA